MKEKIKKFLSLNWQRKHIFAALLFFIILGLVLPFHFVQAIAFLAPLIAYAFIAKIFVFIVALSYAILSFASLILGWVTSPDFIGVPYTTNKFVELGWELTRDLANMFFVIVLVVIGLATALRMGDYGAKKALPLLILIALLINFTLVITGLIIDASNILMRFFLGEGTGLDPLVNSLRVIIGSVASILDIIEAGLKGVFGIIAILATPIFLILFNLLVAVIIFLFAILFAMRYVAIWMLVILSPIAFLFYILPGTRKYFNQWWNQFIQWCFIGVVAAFFLYLANQLTVIIGKGQFILEPEGFGILSSIMPFMVVLAFLVLGFFATLSIGAMGATQIISGTKKGAFWLARRRPVQLGVGKALGISAEKIKEAREKFESIAKEKTRRGRVAKPFVWATRGVEALVGPYLMEKAAELRRFQPPDNWKLMSIREHEDYIKSLSPGRPSDKLILMSKMGEEGELKKADKKFKEEAYGLAKKLKKDLVYRKEVGNIFDALPHRLTENDKIDYELAPITDLEERKTVEAKLNDTIDKLIETHNLIDIPDGPSAKSQAARILHMRGLKFPDFAKLDKATTDTVEFRIATYAMAPDRHAAIRNNFDPETVKKIYNEKRGLNRFTKDELIEFAKKDEHKETVRWAFTHPAGRATLNWSERFPDFLKPRKPRAKRRKKEPKDIWKAYA